MKAFIRKSEFIYQFKKPFLEINWRIIPLNLFLKQSFFQNDK
jgi:hypothetical protein